jgi:NAD(P)-dependent dehydrogenase (short-subunit alcohol dehydrogenase family)
MRLENKVILITGSYTGIGLAIARKCILEGAKVALNGLDKALGQKLIKEFGEANAISIPMDITEETAPKELINKTIEKFGKLDAIVNNAAYIASSNIETSTADFTSKMFAVNSMAPLRIIQAGLKELEKTRGCVLNIGSINAWCGESDLLAYSMSKGALMTLSRNLGDSLFREKGIRVNQINPGWVLTEKEVLNKELQGMKADWYTDLPDIFAPAKRLFTPEEIAAASIFLLSDECGPVSAQVLELEQFPLIGRNLPKTWSGSHNNQ